MSGRWSEEKAWAWSRKTPWLRGCNFMGSDCANRVDQWQEEGFEERLATADRELALAASIGFNSVRLVVQFEVWLDQHDGFLARFDRYLDTAAKHGINAMITLGNDCCIPKEIYTRPKMGAQHVDWGYHGGVKRSPHMSRPGQIGWNVLDDPGLRKLFYDMERELVTRYAHDPRVCIWDIYNEPGNANRWEVTEPYLLDMFGIARDVDPDQPLTAGPFDFPAECLDSKRPLPHLAQACLDNSDVISYHSYASYDENIRTIALLKEYGRPLFNTEWLHRIQHNDVREMFPLFYLENIGCYNWGFVAGLYQTYEPWEGIWQRYEKGEADDVDFTKWQHDLFRPSLRPYDPKEIEIIRRYCKLADERFAAHRNDNRKKE